MITNASRIWKIGFFALGLTLAALMSQWLSQKPARRENPSVRSFMSAMESWNQVSSISKLLSTPRLTQRDLGVARTLLEKTIQKLQACDREELEKIYPGWGANRDLFLSTAFGYLESLDREELRSRDLQEGQRKMDTLSVWMTENWNTLQGRLAKDTDRRQWPSTSEFSL